jgi:hypothetical protein
MNMALLETYRPWITFESWYCVKSPNFLRCTILWDADFQLCSIQAPLSAFAYLAQVIWITSARSSSHSNLAYTLKGMAPTPHAVMPRSRSMWLEVNLTSVGLGTLGVCCKSTWSLSHSKVMCLFAFAIAFHSLRWIWAKGLLKTHAFMVACSWCLRLSSRVNGRLGLPSSIVTLWRVHKCHTKLYLDV